MPGDEDQAQIGMVGSKFTPHTQGDGFLGGLGAAGDENEVVGRDAEALPKLDGAGIFAIGFETIVFDRTGDDDAVSGAAEVAEAGGVLLVLRGDSGEMLEKVRDNRLDLGVAAKTFLAQTAVDDAEGDVGVAGGQKQVGPEFEFGEENRRRF